MIGSTIVMPLFELLEVLGFVRRAEDVRVGRVRLLDAHLVGEAGALHVLGHLLAAAELVDERLIEPRLVDAQRRVGEQAVAIEPLDVVALERAAVAPDVDVVVLHREDEHRAGDGAADRRGVEVGDAGGRDVERAALQRGEALGHELRAAVDQARLLGAVLQRLARNLVVVRLVRLTEVGGVGVRNRALARASSAAPRWCRDRRKTRCRRARRPEHAEELSPSIPNHMSALRGLRSHQSVQIRRPGVNKIVVMFVGKYGFRLGWRSSSPRLPRGG